MRMPVHMCISKPLILYPAVPWLLTQISATCTQPQGGLCCPSHSQPTAKLLSHTKLSAGHGRLETRHFSSRGHCTPGPWSAGWLFKRRSAVFKPLNPSKPLQATARQPATPLVHWKVCNAGTPTLALCVRTIPRVRVRSSLHSFNRLVCQIRCTSERQSSMTPSRSVSMATQGCALSNSTAARVHLSEAILPGVTAPCSGPHLCLDVRACDRLKMPCAPATLFAKRARPPGDAPQTEGKPGVKSNAPARRAPLPG